MISTRMSNQSGFPVLAVALMLNWLIRHAAADSFYEAQFGVLPQDEVNALGDIAKELGKSDWNFNENPCNTNATSWNTPRQPMLYYFSQLNCSNCSAGICHVVTISLKAQNLPGLLPKSLAKLPYLKHVDLAFNYLTGTIPLEWASMSLDYLSVIVNRLSGPIPKYLGNISTLTYLSLEDNMFNGTVPAELGNLVNLNSLTLNGNNFTGNLPRELTNLSHLVELRISRNNFSGHLPDYFKSWRNLTRLEIQGTGFMGPLPSSISELTGLNDLWVSDLGGVGFEFPSLQKMKNIRNLMLRNCNISGSIPKYIAENMQNLKTLYVTSNFLTGSIPSWIKNDQGNMVKDLSYNNFNDSSIPTLCHRNNFKLSVCLDSFSCSKDLYSLYINCGGNVTTVGKTTYQSDIDPGGPATFIPSIPEWGFSSSGHFWFLQLPNADFITTNDTDLHIDDVELYTEGRISGTSLTYYGRCLAEGNYVVTLHFAEIVFRDNNSFYSLGRRIFDVYIQENLVLKDFDITKEANGTDKAVKKTFKHVSVMNSGTIEIRFFYAGKGTVFIPWRGVYGPLISAISVNSEFSHGGKKFITIVVASVASLIVIIAFGVIIWRCQFRSRPSREEVLGELDLRTGSFTLRQIKAATNKFDPTNLIGKGGFGPVYKGTLLDGTHIAVKQLSAKSSQGHKEFVTEIGMLSGLHHPNLVRLYGCCAHGSELFLVYEYLTNNSLASAMFDNKLSLDWPTRQRICIGVAQGLVFLHEESALSIIHRDIKANNILLDDDLNAKISDFGLARLNEEDNDQIHTRIAGTIKKAT
ncbi:hypothetical protein V2J09_017293 [Rumex salicifolius]